MTAYQDLFDLSRREVLVVGAGGIGLEMVKALKAHHATVHVADRSTTALDAVRDHLDPQDQTHELDITDRADVAGLANKLDRLDAVVLTAATNVRKRILDYSESDFDRVVTLNLKGSFNVVQGFGRAMTERGSGSIVAFSSIRSVLVEPGQSVYAATKGGVNQLVKTAAAEFGPYGVRINAVAPGVVDTPLTAQIKSDPEWYEAYASRGALGRWAEPSELTGAVVYLVSDAASYVTGSVLMVDGGWTGMDGRFTPPF